MRPKRVFIDSPVQCDDKGIAYLMSYLEDTRFVVAFCQIFIFTTFFMNAVNYIC